MTNDEILALVESLKGRGVAKIKVGEVEIEFEKRDDSNFDPLQMLEKAEADAKAELMSKLGEEERERLEKKLEDELKYGSA